MGAPPATGVVQLTVACRFCAVATTDCGAAGGVRQIHVPPTAVVPLWPLTSRSPPSAAAVNPEESRAVGAEVGVSLVQVVAAKAQVSLLSALASPPNRTI